MKFARSTSPTLFFLVNDYIHYTFHIETLFFYILSCNCAHRTKSILISRNCGAFQPSSTSWSLSLVRWLYWIFTCIKKSTHSPTTQRNSSQGCWIGTSILPFTFALLLPQFVPKLPRAIFGWVNALLRRHTQTLCFVHRDSVWGWRLCVVAPISSLKSRRKPCQWRLRFFPDAYIHIYMRRIGTEKCWMNGGDGSEKSTHIDSQSAPQPKTHRKKTHKLPNEGKMTKTKPNYVSHRCSFFFRLYLYIWIRMQSE